MLHRQRHIPRQEKAKQTRQQCHRKCQNLLFERRQSIRCKPENSEDKNQQDCAENPATVSAVVCMSHAEAPETEVR